MKPEKKPPVAAGWQALAKSPMTTLWFCGTKVNSSTSPTSAVTEFGLKTKPPLPTLIGMVFAEVRLATASSVVEIFILKLRDGCGAINYELQKAEM